jgi:CheY-like chemotaxis protein
VVRFAPTPRFERSAVMAAVSAVRGPILVVDDDDDLRMMTVLVLRDHGFDVADAANGVEALDFVARRRPSLVLLDLMMPEMNGLEVMTRLQENPALRDLPIVLMTAWSDQTGRVPSSVQVIGKPVEAGELRRAIEKIFGAD